MLLGKHLRYIMIKLNVNKFIKTINMPLYGCLNFRATYTEFLSQVEPELSVFCCRNEDAARDTAQGLSACLASVRS